VFSCGLAWLGLGKGDVPYKDQVCISLLLSFYTYLWSGAKLVESDVFLLEHWADPNLKIRSGEIGSMAQFLSNTPPPHGCRTGSQCSRAGVQTCESRCIVRFLSLTRARNMDADLFRLTLKNLVWKLLDDVLKEHTSFYSKGGRRVPDTPEKERIRIR
jgi:hypothetical protein